MLSTYGHEVDMKLCRAIPVGTLGLGICSLIQRSILLSYLFTTRKGDYYSKSDINGLLFELISNNFKIDQLMHVFQYVLHVTVPY